MTTRIDASRLIPGRGEVIDNGVVVIDENAISYAGSAGDAPDTPDAEVVTTKAVMPGMWECHGHFMGIYRASRDEVHVTRPQMSAMRVVSDARAALLARFTSVRESSRFTPPVESSASSTTRICPSSRHRSWQRSSTKRPAWNWWSLPIVTARAGSWQRWRRALRPSSTFLDEEAAEMMKEKDAILVPTRWIVDLLIREGEKQRMPSYAKKKAHEAAEHHSDAISYKG